MTGLRRALRRRFLARLALRGGGSPELLYDGIAGVVPRLEGWCSLEKATEIARLIVDERAETYVEIGVFGGRSLIPAAMAMKHRRSGVAHGIDPWLASESLVGTHPPVHHQWWAEVDHEATYRGFVRAVLDLELTAHCFWYRTTSEQAAALFPQIDILYIDGNHSEEVSLRDVTLYYPKVKAGGVIIFDDTDWPTTERAWRFLDERCDRLVQIDSAIFYRVR